MCSVTFTYQWTLRYLEQRNQWICRKRNISRNPSEIITNFDDFCFRYFWKSNNSFRIKNCIFVISLNLFFQFYLWQPESYSKNRPVLWLVEFLTILTITMIKIAVNNKQTNMIIGTFNPLSSLTDSSVSTVSLDCYWFSRCCLQ